MLVDNVRFVDIGGIDGHHCLNFLFIINVLPGKFSMELKCYHYDITDVDVLNVFYSEPS